MNDAMNRASSALRTQLDSVLGTVTLSTTAAQLGSKLQAIAPKVQSAALGSTWNQIVLAVASVGDPDDVITGVNGFLAVDDTAGPIIESWTAGIPASVGVFGQLKPRAFSQTFSSNSATYTVSWNVSV